MSGYATPAKLGERYEVQGARRTETEIVCGIQRGCEHRTDGFAGVPYAGGLNRCNATNQRLRNKTLFEAPFGKTVRYTKPPLGVAL